MRKIASVLLVAALLLSTLIPVFAAENTISPFYINTNQARLVMGITEEGVAEITVICSCNSNATGIKATTYIERQVGSSWVRVSNGQTNNEWIATTTARYLAKTYSCQLSISGTYRAVTVLTVSGTETESITLYREATY